MVTPKGIYSNCKVGEYNKWYFDEILPGEERIYKEAQKEYYGKRRQWEIDPKKSVLLIIDMQQDFCSPEGKFWIPANTKLMPKLKKLLKTCRAMKIPVIFTAHQHHPSGRDKGLMGTYLAGTIGAGALTEGTPGVEIYDELEPLPDEWVIKHKRRYDSFWETGLDLTLRSMNKDTIILTGCMTNYCCSTTTRSGMQRDYKIIYGSDLNGTDDPEVHEEVCKTMARGFARVMSCDEVIKELKENS